MRRAAFFVLVLGCSSSEPTTADAAPDTTPLDTLTDTTDVDVLRATKPVFTPPGGLHSPTGATNCALPVEIKSSTPGAVVRFTTDGTTPNAGSPAYMEPLALQTSTTIAAIALAPPLAPSDVAVSHYDIVFPTEITDTPTYTPPPGTYDGPQSVTLKTRSDYSIICYTLDGPPPSCTPLACDPPSLEYKAPVPVTPTDAGVTLRAMACSRCRKSSAYVSGVYRSP